MAVKNQPARIINSTREEYLTQKYPPYLNKFQFDEALLAHATPRQRRLLGDHRPSNYD